MKKQYIAPSLEVIESEIQNVLATVSPLTIDIDIYNETQTMDAKQQFGLFDDAADAE